MFTTGSKLFIGASVISLVAAVVVMNTLSGGTGFMAAVGLLSLTVIFVFLAGINLYTRDGNVPGLEPGAQRTAPAAQRPAGAGIWPFAAALGVAGMVAGAVSKPVVFKVSAIVLIAAAVEWMVQGWSERASGDAAYNKSIRKRMLNPLEYPILGAVVAGLVVYSFSRIMLAADKKAGVWLFIIFGTVVMVTAFLFAGKRNVGKATTLGVLFVAAIGLLGAGVVSAIGGQRTIEEHTPRSAGVCKEEVGEETMAESDHEANSTVSAQASVFAQVELQSNGTLIAWAAGYGNDKESRAQSTLYVPRGAEVNLIFKNNYNDGEEGHGYRLTALLGTFGENPEAVDCTARIEKGATQFLSFKIPNVNEASTTPIELYIPSLPDQRIALVVN